MSAQIASRRLGAGMHVVLPSLLISLGMITVLIEAAPPATVADALKALDLSTVPLLKGAQPPSSRSVSQLSYRVVCECPQAYDFHKQLLLERKWTEAPGSMATDQYASGTFTRDGFVASLTAMPLGDPQQPGLINIALILHGNVDLSSLPIPPGMTKVYIGPQVAMYSTDSPADETTQACRKRLMDAGWQPYGEAQGVRWYKQNAVRLTVSVSAAPALEGKTSVSFSAEQLSADVPAPENTVQLQYADSTKQVLFDTKEGEEAVLAFYSDVLGKSGWKPTTENPVAIDFKRVLIFRNEEKDLFVLEMYPIKDEQVLRVTLRHQSSEEVAEEERRLDEQMAARKRKADTPLPKVSITLPAGAVKTESSATRIEFTIANGQGNAACESLRKSLQEAGWKEEVTIANAMVGDITFRKGDAEISLNYVQPGFIPAEFTLQGRKVELQLMNPGK